VRVVVGVFLPSPPTKNGQDRPRRNFSRNASPRHRVTKKNRPVERGKVREGAAVSAVSAGARCGLSRRSCPPAKRNCTRLAAHKTLAERRDAETTLSIYHQMQRDLALCPPNLQLYGCDYCLVRTSTAYDRDEHLAGHLQFD
jgi:hypothetical protein